MKKLLGTVDCGAALSGTVERKAVIGDIAVARMLTKHLDLRYVVGVVTAVTDAGHVQTIAISYRRPTWEYGNRIYVGARKKLRGMAAEQIAGMLPGSFETYEEARGAIIQTLQDARP